MHHDVLQALGRLLGQVGVQPDVAWLILSNGLLLNAYGVLLTENATLLVRSIPAFGMLLSIVVGAAIYAALAAMKDIKKRFMKTGLERICHLSPRGRPHKQGKWAAYALPVFFFVLWLLAAVATHVRVPASDEDLTPRTSVGRSVRN